MLTVLNLSQACKARSEGNKDFKASSSSSSSGNGNDSNSEWAEPAETDIGKFT